MQPHFTASLTRGVIVVVDLKTGLSVTNTANCVIARLSVSYDVARYRIVYRDTMDRWDGLRVRDGRFAGFVPIGARTEDAAINAALSRAAW